MVVLPFGCKRFLKMAVENKDRQRTRDADGLKEIWLSATVSKEAVLSNSLKAKIYVRFVSCLKNEAVQRERKQPIIRS